MRLLSVLVLGMVVLMPASNLHARQSPGSGQVIGTVTDQATAAPIPTAEVYIQGTNLRTLADNDGRFTLQNVPAGSHTVVAQRLGYTPGQSAVTVTSGASTTVNITLSHAALSLDEVVVVGYGTTERRNLTGAVDQVSGEVLDQRPVPNLTQGLQGMLPNVNVRLQDGKPIQ